MWIKSLHVINFGNLSDLNVEFEPGCNVICRENGWGKSTLSVFIRVMFYGFTTNTQSAKLKKERQTYMPWAGGQYGGSMTFVTGEKTYTVYRTFGKVRTGTQDTFQLVDAATNKPTKDFSANLGEELFGINPDSFINTAYVHQDDYAYTASSEIAAKVSNPSPVLDDINRYDDVTRRINERLVKLSPTRSTGLIYRKKQELESYRTELLKCSEIDRSITITEERLTRKKAQADEISRTKKSLEEKQAVFAVWQDKEADKDIFASLSGQLEDRTEDARNALAYFPVRVPSAAELDDMQAKCADFADNCTRRDMFLLTDSEHVRFEKLQNEFNGQAPAISPASLREKFSALEHMKSEQAGYHLTAEELSELKRLEQTLPSYKPEECELEEQIGNSSRLRRLNLDVSGLNRRVESVKQRIDDMRLLQKHDLEYRTLSENSRYKADTAALESEIRNNSFRIQSLEDDISAAEVRKKQLEQTLHKLSETAEANAGNETHTAPQSTGKALNIRAFIYFVCATCLAAIAFIAGFPKGITGLFCLISGFGLYGLALFTVMSKNVKPRETEFFEDPSASLSETNRIISEKSNRIQTLTRENNSLKQQLESLTQKHLQTLADLENTDIMTSPEELNLREELEQLSSQLAGCRTDQIHLEQTLADFFGKLNLTFDENRTVELLYQLRSDLSAYRSLKSKQERCSDHEDDETIVTMETELMKELSVYIPLDDPVQLETVLGQFESDVDDYRSFTEKTSKFEGFNLEAENRQTELTAFFTGLGFSPRDYAASRNCAVTPSVLSSLLVEIRSHADQSITAAEELKKARRKYDSFISDHPDIEQTFSEEMPECIRDVSSMEELTGMVISSGNRLQECMNAIQTDKHRIDTLSEERTELTKTEERSEILQAEIDVLYHEYRLLQNTGRLMQTAKDSFSAKYMNPIRDSFEKYYGMIDPEHKEDFEIDSDYDVHVKTGGKLREITAVSRGYQDLAGLSIRFALLDAMYEKEHPCVILDDPFVNFDDEKFRRAMEFLQEISKSMQIIFFTCTERKKL